MNAVLMSSSGNPDVLHMTSLPVPRPTDGEVLVRVHAAGVSSVDLSIRSGETPTELPQIPGSDPAGQVLLVGPGVTEWSPGDRVVATGDSLGRHRPGGYAEYLTVPAADLHSLPSNVSFLSSAVVGKTFATAWTALSHHARLDTRERVAVIGGADPTGIAAVQISRWKGSKVIAIADGRHARRLGALGATRVVSQSAADLADRVTAGLDGQAATVVVNVTGKTLPASMQMLDEHGRLVLTRAADPQLLDVQLLVDRRARVIGSANRIDSADMDHILKLLGEGTFVPVIDSIYPLSKVREAHHRAESEQTFGAVLVPDYLYLSGEEIRQLRKEG